MRELGLAVLVDELGGELLALDRHVEEAELERLVGILRQVMEAAKHWDGTETIDVPVRAKDAAKQLIVQLR